MCSHLFTNSTLNMIATWRTCFMATYRHDWATNCWKIGACSNAECDSSTCNWQVFLMNHQELPLRSLWTCDCFACKPCQQEHPLKTNRMTNLEGIADFLLCCLMALDFWHRPAPPPKKKKQEKNRSHLLGFDDSFVYLSIILLETILKPHVFLSSSLWSGSQQQIKKAFYNVLKLESLYVPLSCQVDSSELDPFPVRFQLSAKFVLQFVEMLLRLSKSRSDQDKVCWSIQDTEIMLDSNIKIETA